MPEKWNPFALCDDGSCIYAGCTYPTAANFNPAASVDDGSCYRLGCTDPAANNYNALATVDDGSCTCSGECPGDIGNNAVVKVNDLLFFKGVFGS